ncbi:MAG TPA: hypothetical protein VKA10_02790, partial [Prolixibacteraceae bacterium]|nr:hypothetical protein [Prolixibacteraceae bacterium]
KFVVAVGNSEDKTREIIQNIAPAKIEIVDTVWDENLKEGGAVYAAETDKAFDAVPDSYDWCFYIQGDEVVHEKYLPVIKSAMAENLENQKVEGLLFGYKHFYGTFDYVANSRKWYRNEIRIIRNDKSIRSYRDAQGFRKAGRKLNVVPTGAKIFHYGWVRHPRYMQEKINAVKKFYDGISAADARKKAAENEFNYSQKYDSLERFSGTHPKLMHERIKRLNWNVEVDLAKSHLKLKYRVLHKIEQLFGVRLFEYRNFKTIKKPLPESESGLKLF